MGYAIAPVAGETVRIGLAINLFFFAFRKRRVYILLYILLLGAQVFENFLLYCYEGTLADYVGYFVQVWESAMSRGSSDNGDRGVDDNFAGEALGKVANCFCREFRHLKNTLKSMS